MIVQSYYCINCANCILACLLILMTLVWLDNNGHISNLRSLAFVYYYGVQSRTYGWITKPKEGRGRIRRSMLGGGGVSLDYGALGRAGP